MQSYFLSLILIAIQKRSYKSFSFQIWSDIQEFSTFPFIMVFLYSKNSWFLPYILFHIWIFEEGCRMNWLKPCSNYKSYIKRIISIGKTSYFYLYFSIAIIIYCNMAITQATKKDWFHSPNNPSNDNDFSKL